MQINVTITNLPQIKAAFAKSPTKMASELNIAIRKAALKIQSTSMQNTPVLTGRLRASHQSIFSHSKAIIQPNTDYAFFVHDGTRHMKARPFLYNAVETEEDTVQRYFNVAVQNTLDEIASST